MAKLDMQNTEETVNDKGDLRPVVRVAQAGNLGLWVFVGLMLVGGFWIFTAMQSRRMDVQAPVTSLVGTGGEGQFISSPPALAVPQRLLSDQLQAVEPTVQQPSPAVPQPKERVITRIVEVPAQTSPPRQEAPVEPQSPRPAIVYDAAVQGRPLAPAAGDGANDERVTAKRLTNPGTTVPKGTVIPAVLESALDSTRPGAVRAIVSRDVKGFDGTRVLIPRGSRLYGEYASDMNYGQNRALIRWTRLTRPDAVIINLDSPAGDPLGRAGVKGDVDTHFWTRFGNALLQTSLDVGANVASRSITGDSSVVVAIPQGSQRVGQTLTEGQSQIRPTLRVDHGTSVSVFVAKDLDFSSVES